MSLGMSLEEALENLTVAEVRAVEKHYGKTLDGGQFSGTELTVGVVYAYERRAWLATDVTRQGGPESKIPGWEAFDSWTLKQLNSYFETDAIEVDPTEPETEQGKDDSLAA